MRPRDPSRPKLLAQGVNILWRGLACLLVVVAALELRSPDNASMRIHLAVSLLLLGLAIALGPREWRGRVLFFQLCFGAGTVFFGLLAQRCAS